MTISVVPVDIARAIMEVTDRGITHRVASSPVTCAALETELTVRANADRVVDPTDTDERSFFRWFLQAREQDLPPKARGGRP